MARLSVLEYAADFVRGWPHGSAIEMNYPSDVALGNGDIVEVTSDGKVAIAGLNATTPGVIARGKKDTFNGGGTGTGNLYSQVVPNIVLLSNFVVRTSVIETGATVGAAIPVAGAACGISANGKWAAVDATLTVGTGMVLELESNITLADGTTGVVATILVK